MRLGSLEMCRYFISEGQEGHVMGPINQQKKHNIISAYKLEKLDNTQRKTYYNIKRSGF